MNEKCQKCDYYDGQFYNTIWFNCVPHPYGIEKNCPDFEPRNKPALPLIVMDEMPAKAYSDFVKPSPSRSSVQPLSFDDWEPNSFSLDFLEGYFINFHTRNLTIYFLEIICEYNLSLHQRRVFKKALKQLGIAKNQQIRPRDLIEKLDTFPSLTELSNRIKSVAILD